MNPTDLGRDPIARATAWALLHFIWQGALVGVATAVVLRGMKRSSANARYLVA
jgi:D-alanyl-D-alanine endopeptidase (penicillin-binding protein 7)